MTKQTLPALLSLFLLLPLSGFETDFSGEDGSKTFFPQYGRMPALVRENGKNIVRVPGGTIGRAKIMEVKPRTRWEIEFVARNAFVPHTIEAAPVLEQFFEQAGIRLRMPFQMPTAQVVFYDAAGKVFRHDLSGSDNRSWFRYIHSSQWKKYSFEIHVPERKMKMSLWFLGADVNNDLQISRISMNEVKKASTLNVNPEFESENFGISGIDRYHNVRIEDAGQGRVMFTFRTGSLTTACFPVEPETVLKIAAATSLECAGERFFLSFFDENMRKVGENKEKIAVPNAKTTLLEAALPVPANGKWASVHVRSGTLKSLRVNPVRGAGPSE